MVIPENILRLMWEYDEAALQATTDLPDSVLERVMERGGLSEMRWLLATVERGRLRSYLKSRGRRALPPRELRFWCRMAGIEEPVASGWVAKARAREQSWR